MLYRIFCPMEVVARRAQSVYVDVPGTLVEVKVKPGDTVVKGQELARLTNEQLKLDINKLDRKVAEKKAELLSLLKERSYSGSKAHNEIGAVRQQLESAEKELELRINDLDRLILRAPLGGTVISPPALPDHSAHDDEVLSTWSGTPLESKNLYTLLTRGTLFCQIGNPSELEGVLVIDQSAIDFVRPQQQVEVMLDSLPGIKFPTTLNDISPEKLKESSKQLAVKAGGELETKTDERGIERPIGTVYQAKVGLVDETNTLLPGMRGRARIHAAPQSLGQRTWRMIVDTFNFSL